MIYKVFNTETLKMDDVEIDVPTQILQLIHKGFKDQSEYIIYSDPDQPQVSPSKDSVFFIITNHERPLAKHWKCEIKFSSTTDYDKIKEQREEWVKHVKEDGIFETHHGYKMIFLEDYSSKEKVYVGFMEDHSCFSLSDDTKEKVAQRLVNMWAWVQEDMKKDSKRLSGCGRWDEEIR